MRKMCLTKLLSASLLGLMVFSTAAMAKEIEVVNISKIDGMPWFNRMGEGVTKAGSDLGIKASQVGPSSTDAPQQVKIIEDLIAKKVSAIGIVPNDADVLEPVFKKAREAGIVVLTNESPGNPAPTGMWKLSITRNLPPTTLKRWRKPWAVKGVMSSMSVA